MLVEEEEMKIVSDWGKLGWLFSGKRVMVKVIYSGECMISNQESLDSN